MEDLQSTLRSILSDPEQMARVAALAESLGMKPSYEGSGIMDQGSGWEKGERGQATKDREQMPGNREQETEREESGFSAGPLFGGGGMDLGALMARLSALNGSEDRVLNALRPGLDAAGQGRVDRALRAAKLSRLAAQLLRAREGGHV